ncbi:MAG: hypothetical protein M3O15_07355, partial [Acidobacteriota bacterium]|nr:hypothetical protein [Acidobacteriota bacterium]
MWVGFGAAILPLLVLLTLQYRWLVQLGQTSTLAHRATLFNYMHAVTAEVRYFYRSNGERALNLPTSWFTQNHLERAAGHFGKRCILGAKQLFVISFVGEAAGRALFFTPGSTPAPLATLPPQSPE